MESRRTVQGKNKNKNTAKNKKQTNIKKQKGKREKGKGSLGAVWLWFSLGLQVTRMPGSAPPPRLGVPPCLAGGWPALFGWGWRQGFAELRWWDVSLFPPPRSSFCVRK
ncbi:unnamed protein product [Rangifer tarandus platyrhynchus]|uniref:Uncharacterized protein n=2 Tax=Rangifer tarandus platyrhynchus TaxID=3082113 RepID=A0AC59Y4Q4_RANTA|nr:unnamed protein product [Rangifer tarandus platyrhynchus]